MESHCFREIFRNLVTAKYMPDFDYFREYFSFQTQGEVHQGLSHDLFVGCPCGIEHEYMLYYNSDGTIDEKIYERVVQNIENGACPHVNDTEIGNTTTVAAVYIAVAVGTVVLATKHAEQYRKPRRYFFRPKCGTYNIPRTFQTEMFHLRPYHIAIVKKTYKSLKAYHNVFTKAPTVTRIQSWVMFVDTIDIAYPTKIPVLNVSDIELSVLVRNVPSFKLLDRQTIQYRGLEKILTYSLTHNKYELLKPVQEFVNWLEKRNKFIDLILDCIRRENISLKSPRRFMFKPETNADIIAKLLLEFDEDSNKKMETLFTTNDYHTNTALRVLFHNRQKEFYNFLRSNPIFMGYIQASGSDTPLLHRCTTFYDESYQNASIMKSLLCIGLDVDGLDSNGDTPLMHFLKDQIAEWPRKYMYLSSQRIVRLLIYENSSIVLNRLALCLGLESDARLYSWRCGGLNAKEEWQTLARSALNFIAPLVLECGFRVPTETLISVLEKNELPPIEQDYIRDYLGLQGCPKPLTKICRDVIRMSYKGRLLHSFVEQSNIPNSLRDFLLFTWLLKPLLPENVINMQNAKEQS